MGENNLLAEKCDSKKLKSKRLSLQDHGAKLFILSVITVSFLSDGDRRSVLLANASRIRHGSFSVISAKPCQNALGQIGTCMFMWDCIKTEGVHLGTCSDRFLFGSCCHHNTTSGSTSPLDIAPQFISTKTNSSSQMDAQSSQNSVANILHPITTTSLADLVSVNAQHHSPTQPTLAPVPSVQQTMIPPTRPFIQSTSTINSNGLDEYFSPIFSNNNETNNRTTSHGTSSNQTTSIVVDRVHNDGSRNGSTASLNWINEQTSQIDRPQSNISSPQMSPVPMDSQMQQGDTTTVTSLNSNSFTDGNNSTSPASRPEQLDTNNSTNLAMNSVNQMQEHHDQPNTSPQHQLVGSFQSMLRPSYQPTTTYSSVYMNPLAPSTPQQMIPAQQQNKPQGISWLSKPSLIANAIFHSFKPYLNPNRQRPTYKPYISTSYRPQHYRPLVAQQNQQQKPSFALFGQTAQHHQAIEKPTINSAGSLNHQISIPNTNSQEISMDNNSNNDHHIVNLNSSSSMTDRHRPMDKNHYGIDGSLQQNYQKYGQYDLSNNSSTTLGSVSGSYNYNITLSPPLSPSASYSVDANSTASLDGSKNTHMGLGDKNSYEYDSMEKQPTNTSLVHGMMQTLRPLGVGSQSNLSFAAQNQSVELSGSVMNLLTSNNFTAHQQFPSYPLISGLSNNIVNLPTSDPLDEIHGLSTINTSVSNQVYDKLDAFSTGTSTPGSSMVTNPQGSPATIIYQSQPNLNDHSSMQNSQATHILRPTEETTTLPPGTVLIGNIDDDNPVISTGNELNNGAVASSTSTMETTMGGLQNGSIHTSTFTSVPTSTLYESTPSSSSGLSISPIVTMPVTSSTTTTDPLTSSSLTQPVDAIKKGTVNQVGNNGFPLHIRDPNSKEVACGVTSMYPQTKVVGGKNAAFGAWPWQVSVRKVSFFGFSSTHRCGGAVISSEWIATAGHCVEDLALQSIRIRVGEYDFSSVSEPYPHIERAARKKVVHPKYNFYTYENDLALVQLDQPLQFPPHVAPICLPPDNIDLLGRNATVTGWGRLNEGGTLPTILQEVRVPIVSNDKCKDMFLNAGRPEYIPDIFLCAGYEEGGRDSCQGDSGGPLQVRGDDGKWFLAGIISWGIGCAEQNLPGVCTRISRFKLWIQSTMNANSNG